MIGKLLLGAACALTLLSCEPTTYGQAVQQQKRGEAAASGTGGSGQAPYCPTPAAPGSSDYGYCEQELTNASQSTPAGEDLGIGGSGDLRCKLAR